MRACAFYGVVRGTCVAGGTPPGSGAGTSIGSGAGTSFGSGTGTSVGICGLDRGGGSAGSSRGKPGTRTFSAANALRSVRVVRQGSINVIESCGLAQKEQMGGIKKFRIIVASSALFYLIRAHRQRGAHLEG